MAEFRRSARGVEFEAPRDDLSPPPKRNPKMRWDLAGLLRPLLPGQSMALRVPDGLTAAAWQATISTSARRLWGKGGAVTRTESARVVRIWRATKDGADG
jgi:hypothetical protein